MTKTHAPFDRILAQHEALNETVQELKTYLGAPRPDVEDDAAREWASGLARRLVGLHEELNRHFQEEEASGFLGEMVADYPPARRKAKRLLAEHGQMRNDLHSLIEAALAYSEHRPTGQQRLRRWTLTIVQRLVRHERKETDLIQRLYTADLGEVD